MRLSRPKIFLRLMGGLGNQMFQYAAGRALSLRLGQPLALDLSWFNECRDGTAPRDYGLSVFPITAEIAEPSQIETLRRSPRGLLQRAQRRLGRRLIPRRREYAGPFIAEPRYEYWPGFARISGAVHLTGYWQSPRYFEAFADAVRADFEFPPLPPGQSRTVAGQISAAPNSVAIHVRRGDYVTNPRMAKVHGGCCSPDYYVRAIRRLADEYGALDLFLFSDDPDWLHANFEACGQTATVVDVPAHRTAPHHDMHLMTLAKHHIIANSSFSWWGAWLARAADKTVVAPRKWFANADETTALGTHNRFPSTWLAI